MVKPNPLLELCNPILQLTTVFRTGNRGIDLPADYGAQLKTALDDLERIACAQQIPLFEVQHIKYALTAFVDEAILNSAWPERTTWMGQPLQLQYFGEHIGGEGFFKRLTDLRQSGSQYINVLEVYYLCLQLGFEGMYRMQGLEKLLALQVDLHNQITTAHGPINPNLAPNGLPGHNLATKVGRKFPLWVIASLTACLIFCTYLGYAIAINQQANKSAQKIDISRSKLLDSRVRGNDEGNFQK